MGYHRAGFEVVGVDHKPQKNYPFEFHQADALTYPLDGFDVIHASPPCQAYSVSRNNGCRPGAPMLIEQTRERLKTSRSIYVIENVLGAPLIHPFMLCGHSFKLGSNGFQLARHRYFECNILLLAPPCNHVKGQTMGVYGHGTNKWHREKFGRCIREEEKREAMGIDWMTRDELKEAIPPAYTEWIGKHLIERLSAYASRTEETADIACFKRDGTVGT